MADHTIHAELLPDGRVSIPPVTPSEKPLEVEPGDTVEWSFVDAQGQAISDATIEFLGFLPESRFAPILGRGTHPFDRLLSTQTQKTGIQFPVADTDRGLYLYAIVHGGQLLEWDVPLFTVGSFRAFFAGIIIRDPPGGG